MARKYHSSWWLLRAVLALILALIVGLAVGCSNHSNSTVTPGNDKPPVATPDTPVKANPEDNGTDPASGTGSGSNPGTDQGTDSSTGGASTDNGGGTDNGAGTGSSGTPTPAEPNNPPSKPVDSGNGGSKEPVIVAENEAFRIYAPADDAVVGKTFKVTGEARVFEAAFSYSFEDGHNVLAEGHVMADQGAPEWGKFEFEVTFKEATSPYGILIIYESSAKDGSPVHQLEIRVKFADGIVKPVAGEA